MPSLTATNVRNSTMKTTHLVFVAVTLITLSSCTYVRLTPEGENVAVLTQSEVAGCNRTGTTTVEVLDKVVINRNPERVALELRTLARNRAADRGDAIVASSEVGDGEQAFVIYRCRD
jgi:hypothetical protein